MQGCTDDNGQSAFCDWFLVSGSTKYTVQRRTTKAPRGLQRGQAGDNRLHPCSSSSMDLLSLPDNVFLKLLNELSNIHSQTLTNLAMTCWGMRRATIGAWKQLSVNVRALVSLSTQQQWGHVKAAILRDFLCSLGEGTRVCLSADWGRRNEEVPCHLSSCLGAMYALHTRPLDSVKTLSLEVRHVPR